MRSLNRLVVLLAASSFSGLGYGQHSGAHSFEPKAGFVPDEVTAIRIAEAVWLPIYGSAIYAKKPFTAKLRGDVWLVEGSLRQGLLGGVPLAEISRIDGRVVRISHGQ